MTSPESTALLPTQHSLRRTCSKVATTLLSLNKYLLNCFPHESQDLYFQLFSGIKCLFDKVCANKAFKNKFKKHQGCLETVHEELGSCAGPADWEENFYAQKQCQVYRKVFLCFQRKSSLLCGPETSQIMLEVLKTVLDCTIPVKCLDGYLSTVKFTPYSEETIEQFVSSAHGPLFDSKFLILILLSATKILNY